MITTKILHWIAAIGLAALVAALARQVGIFQIALRPRACSLCVRRLIWGMYHHPSGISRQSRKGYLIMVDLDKLTEKMASGAADQTSQRSLLGVAVEPS